MNQSFIDDLRTKSDILSRALKHSETEWLCDEDYIGNGVYSTANESMITFFDRQDISKQVNSFRSELEYRMNEIRKADTEEQAQFAYESAIQTYRKAQTFIFDKNSRTEGFYNTANKAIYQFMLDANSDVYRDDNPINYIAEEAVLDLKDNDDNDDAVFEEFLNSVESAMNAEFKVDPVIKEEIDQNNSEENSATESFTNIDDPEFESMMNEIDNDLKEIMETDVNAIMDDMDDNKPSEDKEESSIDDESEQAFESALKEIDSAINVLNGNEEVEDEYPEELPIIATESAFRYDYQSSAFEALSRLAEDAVCDALATMNLQVNYGAIESGLTSMVDEYAMEGASNDVYCSFLIQDELDKFAPNQEAMEGLRSFIGAVTRPVREKVIGAGKAVSRFTKDAKDKAVGAVKGHIDDRKEMSAEKEANDLTGRNDMIARAKNSIYSAGKAVTRMENQINNAIEMIGSAKERVKANSEAQKAKASLAQGGDIWKLKQMVEQFSNDIEVAERKNRSTTFIERNIINPLNKAVSNAEIRTEATINRMKAQIKDNKEELKGGMTEEEYDVEAIKDKIAEAKKQKNELVGDDSKTASARAKKQSEILDLEAKLSRAQANNRTEYAYKGKTHNEARVKDIETEEIAKKLGSYRKKIEGIKRQMTQAEGDDSLSSADKDDLLNDLNKKLEEAENEYNSKKAEYDKSKPGHVKMDDLNDDESKKPEVKPGKPNSPNPSKPQEKPEVVNAKRDYESASKTYQRVLTDLAKAKAKNNTSLVETLEKQKEELKKKFDEKKQEYDNVRRAANESYTAYEVDWNDPSTVAYAYEALDIAAEDWDEDMYDAVECALKHWDEFFEYVAMESMRFDFSSFRNNIKANMNRFGSQLRTFSIRDIFNVIITTIKSFYQSLMMRLQGKVIPVTVIEHVMPTLRRLNYEMALWVDSVVRIKDIYDEDDPALEKCEVSCAAIDSEIRQGMNDLLTLQEYLMDIVRDPKSQGMRFWAANRAESENFIRMCNEAQRQFSRMEYKANSVFKNVDTDNGDEVPSLYNIMIKVVNVIAPYLANISKLLDYVTDSFDKLPQYSVAGTQGANSTKITSVAPFARDIEFELVPE